MDDSQVHGTIEQLVAEEHELWEREAAGNASESDRQRLQRGEGLARPMLGPAAPAPRAAGSWA